MHAVQTSLVVNTLRETQPFHWSHVDQPDGVLTTGEGEYVAEIASILVMDSDNSCLHALFSFRRSLIGLSTSGVSASVP